MNQLFAIGFWVCLFSILIGTIRSKQIPSYQLWAAMRRRLPIVITLNFVSGILNATMSGTIGFYGGFLAALLGWSGLLLVKFVATRESRGSISPRDNAR